MIKNLESNKAYDLYEVLGIKQRKSLKEIWWKIEQDHDIKKYKLYLDRYASKCGYKNYDESKCNIDNMPMIIWTHKDEYNKSIARQLEDQGIIHCIWDKGCYNCDGEWSQTFVVRYKDYYRVCEAMRIEADKVNREDVIAGVHDGLWDNIGDLVEDKQYSNNEHKYDAVKQIVINYIVENMDRFINYFFKYDEYEALERMYYDSKRELRIK